MRFKELINFKTYLISAGSISTEKYLGEQRKLRALDTSLAKKRKKCKSRGKCRLDSPLRSTIYGMSSLRIRAGVIGASILKRSLILTRLFPLERTEEKYVPPGSYLQRGLSRELDISII